MLSVFEVSILVLFISYSIHILPTSICVLNVLITPRQDGLSNLSPDHPMISISANKSQHLVQNHVDYVMHWVGLLLLEEADQLKSDKLRHIWRFSPEERFVHTLSVFAFVSISRLNNHV